MRYVRIVLLLLTAIVLVIFSVQNSDFAVVKFLGWSAETSMALLLLISFLIGSFSMFLFLIPSVFRRTKTKVVEAPLAPAPIVEEQPEEEDQSDLPEDLAKD